MLKPVSNISLAQALKHSTLHLPVDQREEGTLATTVIGMMKGCAFVRVHDVQANRRAVDMTAAILRAGEEA